jgi:hypothetical protein
MSRALHAAPPAARALGHAVVLAGALGGCTRITERLVPAAVSADAAAGDDAAGGPWNCGSRCFSAGVGASPADSFTGPPDTAAPPALLYPLAEAVLPAGLGAPALQWRRTSDVTQTLFRFHLAGPSQQYDLFAPCPPPTGTMTTPASTECIFTPPEAVWRAIIAENAGQRVTMTLAATNHVGGAVATSAPLGMALSAAPLSGGVYYWSYADSGIHRALFTAASAVPFVTPGSSASPQGCGGCHAISRDGGTIAFSAGDLGYLNVARTTVPGAPLVTPPSPPIPDGSTMSLTADGRLVAVSHGASGADAGHLVVRETASGREVARLDPAVLGTAETHVLFPEWSPDGSEIVATLSSHSLEARTASDGYLAVIPYKDGAFGPARVVVPKDAGGLVHFAPTWSPDGQFILFVSARPPSRVMNDVSYDNPSATLRLARSDGSGVVSELPLVNQGGGHTAGWPRFVWSTSAPWWFTFHAKLDYGVQLKNHEVAGPKGGLSQIWLATLDPARLPQDPSSAPIWLPFQDARQINNMAVPAPIACAPAQFPPGGCAAGETCAAGLCLSAP